MPKTTDTERPPVLRAPPPEDVPAPSPAAVTVCLLVHIPCPKGAEIEVLEGEPKQTIDLEIALRNALTEDKDLGDRLAKHLPEDQKGALFLRAELGLKYYETPHTAVRSLLGKLATTLPSNPGEVAIAASDTHSGLTLLGRVVTLGPRLTSASKRSDSRRMSKSRAAKTTSEADSSLADARLPSPPLEELTLEELRAKMRVAYEQSGLTLAKIGEKMGYNTKRAAQNVQELMTSSNPSILYVGRFANACGMSLIGLLSLRPY